MHDLEPLKIYHDTNRVKLTRFDYAHILERLQWFAEHKPGAWVFIALHPDRNPTTRLKDKASEDWTVVETFTRRERPRCDDAELWHEIWARIKK